MPLQLTPRPRGLPRERRTGRRVHADLTEASSSVSFLLPAAFRRTVRAASAAEASHEVRPLRTSRSDLAGNPSQAEKTPKPMTTPEQDRWSRVKGRLRSTVGEDVYSS